MTISEMSPPELLLYWIRERYEVFLKKKNGGPKPWSEDPVFQTTYFCNVRREDDKVTKWIREFYLPYHSHPMFEYNILLSRFLNRPETLEYIGYQYEHNPKSLLSDLEYLAEKGKVWGNAYVITTHGIPMPKATYLCQNVLGGAYRALESRRKAPPAPWCQQWYRDLQAIEGVGSFLAAQIIADLKNTTGHILKSAPDWWTFVAPGPGSLRGVSWFCNGDPKSRATLSRFGREFQVVRNYVDANWNESYGPPICSQDLQNCLCEFDKYMRVKNGTGRSKRSYPGT